MVPEGADLLRYGRKGKPPVRYRGRDPNEFDFALTLTACNIKRGLSLTAA